MDMSETSPRFTTTVGPTRFRGCYRFARSDYLVRNVDRYEDLNTEFRYGELVEMVEPIQETVEAAMLSGNFNNLTFLDSGNAGLPAKVLASEQTHVFLSLTAGSSRPG